MRRSVIRWLSLLAVLALLLAAAATASAHQPPDADSGADEPAVSKAPAAPTLDLATYPAKRWIVQLKDAPVAKYNGGVAGYKATSAKAAGQAKLDADSGDAKAYAAYLESQQKAFASTLSKVAPGAKVEQSYQVVLNGVAVRMSAEQAKAVRKLPNVRAVTPDVPYQLQMYSTPQQIGAPTVWAMLGGQDKAGDGVKVGIIDSGIFVRYDASGNYTGNICFNDTGYTMPPGFPKGDTRFTNKKVIVARAYFRPDDPPIPGEDTPIQGVADTSPHGTHVAGTVACDANTPVTYQGANLTISGVAPRAYLMNYRVFYESQSPEDFQNGNAYVVELVKAIEDSVKDGADVISNSWGATYQNTLAWPDPMIQAAEAAWDAGVVGVFAASNAGPDLATVSSPAISGKVIAVAAVTKNATISPGVLNVTAPPPVPSNLTNLDVGPANFGPQITTQFPAAAYVPAEKVATNGSALGCSLSGDVSPFPAGSLTGKIALISRGTCTFSEKVFNAQRGGAVAALVYNSAANGDNLQAMGPGAHAGEVTIPSWFMRRSDGLNMRTFYNSHPGDAEVGYTYQPHPAPNVGDIMAGFSSRGPSQGWLLKPDVAAPGVDILSSGYGEGPYPEPFTGFGSASGTSMATPHVAGAAALLKQLHPTWTPTQIKSALMSTATEAVFLNTGKTVKAGVLDRGAGRIDLTKAGTPGLTTDPQSISGGLMAPGQSRTFTVNAKDVSGSAGAWSVSTTQTGDSATTANFSITVGSPTLNVAANGNASFTVTVAAAASAAGADYEGSVVLTNSATSTTIHLPVWLRVMPTTQTADVLLVDDDGSSIDSSFPNVSEVYTSTLQSLGVSYTYLDVGQEAFPQFNALAGYKAVVIFTGKNNSFDTSGFSTADQDRLTEWLNAGGRLWMSGQDLADTTDSNASFISPSLGRARLYHGYLGLTPITEDLYNGATPPKPSANGVGPMSGVQLALTASPAGSGLTVEATKAMTDTDTYMATETMRPFFHPLGATVSADTNISWGRASDPTLESPMQKYIYRSASMGFGLENIDNAAGLATQQQVAAKTMAWLMDTLSVSLSASTASQFSPTTLTASATSSGGAAITQYRWDFGDGSPIQTTTAASVQHTYTSTRPATARVEATDALGHTAIASAVINPTPYQCPLNDPKAVCNGFVLVRAFIDYGCNVFWTPGDTPLVGTTLMLAMPDGTTKTTTVDSAGNAIFTGVTLPPQTSATLTADSPVQPTWIGAQGLTLNSCPNSPTSVTLTPSSFNRGQAYEDFRWNVAR
ncbi:MAG: S8 family serine peptidase [Anaerolineae bacterium]